MILRPPEKSDWERFAALVCSEGWRVPWSELQRFKGPWSQSAHVLDDDGFCGLVTVVAYEKSAWIGNLIIPSPLRRKGYGTYLFKSVLADLVGSGLSSVWLTASDQGRGLYEREGFVAIDRIERWVLSPSGREITSPFVSNQPCGQLLHADWSAWGEQRHPLLPALCKNGKAFAVENAVALLQAGPDVQVVGPWYSNDASYEANQALLSMVMAAAEPGVEVVIDLLGSSPVRSLCEAAGFSCSGQTSLMAYGDIRSIKRQSMVSLASLGSVG